MRSVESRFYAIGNEPLKLYYTSNAFESFLDILSSNLPKQYTKDTTYCEVAYDVYNLFEDPDVTFEFATKKMLRLIAPLYNRTTAALSMGETPHDLLTNPAFRKYVLYLNEYNEVVDCIFQEIPISRYRYLSFLQNDLLYEIIHKTYRSLITKDGFLKPEPTSEADKSLQRKQIYILKEIFVDPYYYLWKHSHC